MEQPQELLSYEYNFRGSYYIEPVTGTFYKLTSIDETKKPSVIYVPQGNGLNDYLAGGSKQKKTRKNRRNRRKSDRRR
jgi:hypothetical protein